MKTISKLSIYDQAPLSHRAFSRYATIMISLLAVTSCFESVSPLCASGIRCPRGMFCSADGQRCTLPPDLTCGNHIIEPEAGETCDFGKYNSDEPDAECRTDCQLPRCGDGVLDSSEVCDDGNNADSDGCSETCMSNEQCGNGSVDTSVGEQCDDGNTLARDGCSSSCFTEERFWHQGNLFSAIADRLGHAMAYDTARGRVVLFGGYAGGLKDDTWEWDGQVWQRMEHQEEGPSARDDHAMAYDAVRGRTVLFGGFGSALKGDATWEWDGQVWYRIEHQSEGPPARKEHAMAYDAARERIVLFGGYGGGLKGDTWEWDGHVWHRIEPRGERPSARRDHAMAYDAARDRVVLFGGSDGEDDVFWHDTWEWDGRVWHRMEHRNQGPSARKKHAMAYDAARQRVVLFGGYDGNDRFDDTWEWDGQTWHRIPHQNPEPSARAFHAMAYDAVHKRVVLFGGSNGRRLGDTWVWDGQRWRHTEPQDQAPPARAFHAMAHDAARGRVVLFGGRTNENVTGDGTWEWDGQVWHRMQLQGATPSTRTFHAMTYAAVQGHVVLFGGNDGGLLGDTWEWDGRMWHETQHHDNAPPPRQGHAMTYDPVRDRVVLFGGYDSAPLNDTWEWDGRTWHRMQQRGIPPSPRQGHAMAYDAARGRVVLFGGSDGEDTFLDDTWEWDGQMWHHIEPRGELPLVREVHAMAYDATRGRVLLFGGGDNRIFDDTWEWNGQEWRRIQSQGDLPSARYGPAMVYNAARGRVILFGGFDGKRLLDDTWHLAYQSKGEVYEGCSNNIDNDGDSLTSCEDPDCWAYCTPHCLPYTNICETLALPQCGDGQCNWALENHLNCPSDCQTVCGDFLCETGDNLSDCSADCR